MKKFYILIVLALILGLVLTGCTLLSNVGQVPTTDQSGINYLTKHTEGDPFTTDLIADGGDETSAIDVGDVLVWNDGDYLYVKYVITDSDWCLTETHLHVFLDNDEYTDVPQKNGNPPPGQFDYKEEHECVPDYTYEIPLIWDPEAPLFIAAHAVVQKTTIAPYYASIVVDYHQGLTKGGGSVRLQRSTPEQGLEFETGENESNFFSLGFGGWIIVEFDCPIQNGDGNDVKIIEDTWGLPYPLEKANVYASQDGTTWTWLGVADNTDLDVIHTISEFDLGILNWAKYIKIEDISDPAPHNSAADGYDLNAIEALHDCIREETAWADGLDFPGKNWATYFTYFVTEGVLEVTQESPQNELNKSLDHPYINWTIDGLCIEFEFVNPTDHCFVFDYRVDGEEGESHDWSDTVITGGELAGELIGLRYNWVVVGPNETVVVEEVCVEEEVWVGMRLGAENDWYLDWIIFEAKW